MTSLLSLAQKKNLIALIVKLGKEVEIIKHSHYVVCKKKNDSPVSKADLFVNDELKKYINKTSIKNIISEENIASDYISRKKWNYFWMIDPIDGTKEFLNKSNDYTINLALCKRDMPIFSIVYAPGYSLLYHAEKDNGAYLNGKKISVNTNLRSTINVAVSKSHLNKETQDFLNILKKKSSLSLKNLGSSLKICKIAEGVVDIYPRLGPTMEWDTCAAHLILKQAGGNISSIDGKELTYNKRDLRNPFFIASSGKTNSL